MLCSKSTEPTLLYQMKRNLFSSWIKFFFLFLLLSNCKLLNGTIYFSQWKIYSNIIYEEVSNLWSAYIYIYIYIDFKVRNLNSLQNILLGDAQTSHSASATFGKTPGMQLLDWCSSGHHILHDVLSWLKSSPFQHHFQLGK